MAKTGKKGGGGKKKSSKREDSSDDDLYKDDVDFDPKNPFGDDDLEQFHAKKDKDLMSAMKKSKNGRYSSDEEEVLAFDDDDDSDDDESDGGEFNIEDDDEDDDDDEGGDKNDEDMPNASWGSRKSSYYSGNKIQNEEDAELEEEEARLLQSKMMKQLDTSDFGLEAFSLTSKSEKDKLMLKTSEEIEAAKLASRTFSVADSGSSSLQKVAKNLKDLSKREKLELLKQESPELLELVRDFKDKIEELESTLLPLYHSIKSGQVQSSRASEFILQKTKLYLTYSSYLNFYFILKSERTPVDNHPIIKSILQYRNLCKQLSPIDQKLQGEVEQIRQALESNKMLTFRAAKSSKEQLASKAKKTVRFNRGDKTETATMSDSDEDETNMMKDDNDDEKSTKRPINYKIEKNRGLTPKRPKEYRNPRVRNRLKARKANIKHKSIVPKVRPQEKRYAGEGTGIRMNVVRSHKIK